MRSKTGMGGRFIPELIRRGLRHVFLAVSGRLGVKSYWRWELWRNGEMIDCAPIWRANLVPNQALDYLLGLLYKSSTQYATAYIALFEDDHTPASGDTYQTPGYTECTAYDEASRQACSFGSISSQSVDNSASKASFTISDTKTLYGAALVVGPDADDKGDTTAGNYLMCSVNFGAGVPVEDDDVFKVTCTQTASDAT